MPGVPGLALVSRVELVMELLILLEFSSIEPRVELLQFFRQVLLSP